MAQKALVIVESPAKAKTINKYLGKDFVVKASVGHVRDLPKSSFGVDLENGFEPRYVTMRDKKKVIDDLKNAASKADIIYLASDPDREGEAISWHVYKILEKECRVPFKRVLFNEITKKAVQEAIAQSGEIDQRKVDAQQARRILDRIVGYQISPLLWDKISRNLSAGRVQSVALRLVCEREAEIDAFVQEEYWSIFANFTKENTPFQAKLSKINGKKAEITNGEQAQTIVDALKSGAFQVSELETKQKKKRPLPPFTTSKLQQDASRKLRFSAKKTMMVAQSLYEGVNLGPLGSTGLITYMRTDSTRVSDDALQWGREFIATTFGPEYLPEKPRVFASKKQTQDAHEAIRPTAPHHPDAIREYLTGDQYRMYKIIFEKFIASQMADALVDSTVVDIKNGSHTLRAIGNVITFAGHLALYNIVEEDEPTAGKEEESGRLPRLAVGEALNADQIAPQQHFTQPAPRYSEATLVKTLEEKGIGRPSTYASILSTIEDRKYVEKEDRKFTPTELGKVVNELLVTHFRELFDYNFTANLESELDLIEEGKKEWRQALGTFYTGFKEEFSKAQEALKGVEKINIRANIPCPKCTAELLIKNGRNGEFLACSTYPECSFTANFSKDEEGNLTITPRATDEPTNIVCDKCQRNMVIKMSRRGPFLACSGYPECKNAKSFTKDEEGNITIIVKKPAEQTTIACDKCGATMVVRSSKRGEFLACSAFPKCRNAKSMERDEAGQAVVVEKKEKATAKKEGKATVGESKAAAKTPAKRKTAAAKKTTDEKKVVAPKKTTKKPATPKE